MTGFTDQQLERYSRHIILREVGVEGQLKIMRGKVLIVGAGGLGSPAALYLAAAGVGTIGIVDSDKVELSNLQRQVIHFTKDMDTAKVTSAGRKMRDLNPDTTVRCYHEAVRAHNIRRIIRDFDFVIDGTDNFAAKFLINDACIMESTPFSHGGILRFAGQTLTVLPGRSACCRCIFKSPPPPDAVPSCSQAGVLGPVAGMLGTIQAVEALKFLLNVGMLLTDTLLVFDAFTMDFSKIPFRRNPDCALCGKQPSIVELFDEQPPVCEVDTKA